MKRSDGELEVRGVSAEISSFVALGDSFTEGRDDPAADLGGYRGWADRFAQRVAAQRPGLRYANLAVRGKLLSEVVAEQVPRAIEMTPDLVSIAAGGNDMLRPRADPDALAEVFDEAVAALLGNSIKVAEKHYAPWVKSRQLALEESVKKTWAT